MLIAVLVLVVVVLIEAYIIVEKESRIIYLRKRLLRQIRMNDSMKLKLQSQKVLVFEKPDLEGAEKVMENFKKSAAYEQMKNLIVHPSWGQTSEELLEYLNGIKGVKVEVGGMPIEMTEVFHEDRSD